MVLNLLKPGKESCWSQPKYNSELHCRNLQIASWHDFTYAHKKIQKKKAGNVVKYEGISYKINYLYKLQRKLVERQEKQSWKGKEKREIPQIRRSPVSQKNSYQEVKKNLSIVFIVCFLFLGEHLTSTSMCAML